MRGLVGVVLSVRVWILDAWLGNLESFLSPLVPWKHWIILIIIVS